MQNLHLAYAWVSTPLIALFLFLLGANIRRRMSVRYPPGPNGLPFVGNALQIPTEYPHYVFEAWAKRYGDIVYTEAFGHRTIIVSSHKIAKELLEKRGSKYSGRPRFVMLTELLGWNPSVSLLPYKSEDRQKQRRWIRSMYGEKRAMKAFDHLKMRETCILLLGLMDGAENLGLHVKRYVAAIVLESAYGHRITSLEDPFIMLIDKAMEDTTATGLMGGNLVDVLPLLKHVPSWMPGAAFKRAAQHARETVRKAHHVPYSETRERMLRGEAPPSLVSNLVEQMDKAGRLEEEENRICYAAGVVYGGATDTTKAALLSFLLAMVLHPVVFEKAQNEVDRVIGKARLPTHEDRSDLPYIDCILKELYRWGVPIPLGVPHRVDEDDVYEGYAIPKGTNVITNLWAMCRDERIWEDPAAFRPERFLQMSDSEAEALDPRNVVFGYGRRVCPGKLFADTTLFLVIANIAATLNIRKARDAAGKEITPKVAFQPAFINNPVDFACVIEARSDAAKHLVAETLGRFTSANFGE